jgi:predicted nucleotide-binding protein (sugar kinase/HSP70/actin superfamily)
LHIGGSTKKVRKKSLKKSLKKSSKKKFEKKFEKMFEKKFAKKVQKYYKLSEGGEGWGGVGRVENCHSNA